MRISYFVTFHQISFIVYRVEKKYCMKLDIFLRHCWATTLVLLALPAVVQAQFTFITNNGSITITGYTGPGGAVAIPGMINGYTVTSIASDQQNGVFPPNVTSVTIPNTVTSIGASAFSYSSLTNIVIPTSVTSVGQSAFSYCESLTSVTIPDSVTSIGVQAFETCESLTNIVIPSSVTNIGQSAFFYCERLASVTIPDSVASVEVQTFADCESLTNIVIPNSVTNIGGWAFEGCVSLTSVTIPSSVTSIGEGSVFGGCSGLTNISVDSENQSYSSLDGVLLDKAQDTLIVYPAGLTNGSYTVPSDVTNIDDEAFIDCGRLASVIIPSSVRTIGGAAFYSCTSLTNIVIPNSVTSIGGQAFEYCPLTSVTVPSSVTSIGGQAFYLCTDLTSAYFEGNAPPDNGTVFSDDLLTVYYQSGTTGWGATFGGAPAVEETAPNEFSWVTNSDAVSITITAYTGPGGSVVIPNMINGYYVTSIGQQAFFGCDSLTSIVIPEGVTNIGPEAFEFCTGLTSAFFVGNVPPDFGNAFYGDPDAIVDYALGAAGWGATFGGAPTTGVTPPFEFNYQVADGSITITGYNGHGGVVVIPANIYGYAVTSIGSGGPEVFGGRNVTSVTIPASVTSIGGYAFQNCVSLTNIVIPNSVTSVGVEAFAICKDLTSVTVPSSVTNIGGWAFEYCVSLTNILIPNSVTSIGDYAFQLCTNLTSITIPASVANIGDNAFEDCTNLRSAYFHGNAPPNLGTAFSYDPATVYYLPGTSGWTETFGSVPTELWNPQATSFTTASGQFGFSISGPTNTTIVVEACTNLTNPVWLPVSTNTLSASGTSSFSDLQSMNYPNRYYRFSAP